MTILVYLDFFEIYSTLFKEFHEIGEVLHAWLVMTTIGHNGLSKNKYIKIRQKLKNTGQQDSME
jgi:hypothetical protein